jgi:hypothetical protein
MQISNSFAMVEAATFVAIIVYDCEKRPIDTVAQPTSPQSWTIPATAMT